MFLTFVSCQKEDSLVNDETLSDSKNIFIQKVTNTDIINEFKSKVTILKSTKSIIFDTDNIFEVGLSESDPKVLIANQVGFDECNDSNFGFTIAIDDNGNLGQSAIIKTESVDEQTKIINYYNDNYTLMLSLKLDVNTESIEILYKSIGQDVMDCIEDAYTNHGWISVGLFIETAFIPETAAAIAAACLGRNS